MTSISSCGVVWAVAVVGVGLGDARADAHKRLVVLPFEGPHASAFHHDVVELLKPTHTVISTARWLAAAKRMNARKLVAHDVHRIATKLDVAGVLSGTVAKRGRTYRLELELRDGASGQLVATRDIVASGLDDELLPLIDELDAEADDDAVSVVDDAEPTATAPSVRAPLRVAVECETQSEARTKACPEFLLGFIEAHDTLSSSPRSHADVILYATIAEVALVDRVHLRFVGTVAGAPPIVETDVDLDTRADDDSQRGQLEPGFLRGIALFVAARHPDAVAVTLGPTAAGTVAPDTSPWDVKLELGGSGNWTDQYQSYNGTSDLSVTRLASTSRVGVAFHANGGVNRQPSIVLPDGTSVSVDTNQWRIGGSLNAAWLFNDHWSFGGAAGVLRDDPKGQYDYTLTANAGIEWDCYQANDPRGNRLAVLYVAGYQVDRYNLRDTLGETFARYPIHQLIASGTVREDKVGIGIALAIGAEVLEPMRRNHISASPFIEWKLGEHVDLNVAVSITRRQLPEPDPREIDQQDYGLLSRLSYAQSLTMNGALSLSLHSDRTNGARNDRFTDL